VGEWVGGFGCHCMAVATAIQWKHGIVWARRGAPCMARLGGGLCAPQRAGAPRRALGTAPMVVWWLIDHKPRLSH
jgi:hypothetical protein